MLPGTLASIVNDDWLETQRAVVAEANAIQPHLPLMMTVSLSGDAVREDQIARLLEAGRLGNARIPYRLRESKW